MNSIHPEITVAVPTRNRRDQLSNLLLALERQTLDPSRFEIVVVDDGSRDGTAEFLAGWQKQESARRRVRRLPGSGPAAARNAGIQEARGRIIAFIDDDCEPEAGWLAALGRALDQDPDLAGVGGETLPPENPVLISRFIHTQCVMRTPEIKGGVVLHLQTNNAAFRRADLLAMQGFDESFTLAAGEDWDLSRRLRLAGKRLGFAPEARVVHHHRHTLSGFIRSYYGYGRGEAMMLRYQTRPRQLLRGLYRLRLFFNWILIPWRILKMFSRPDLSTPEKFIFPWLESLRQILHTLGFLRQLPLTWGQAPTT
jgi:GT2 family glycosyltransferase